jgi:hypothetical protein
MNGAELDRRRKEMGVELSPAKAAIANYVPRHANASVACAARAPAWAGDCSLRGC